MHARPETVVQRDKDVFLTIRVQPKASRESVSLHPQGAIRIALTAPPVEGAANMALIALLSKVLGVPKRRVVVEHGVSSRNKIVRILDITAQVVHERLERESG